MGSYGNGENLLVNLESFEDWQAAALQFCAELGGSGENWAVFLDSSLMQLKL